MYAGANMGHPSREAGFVSEASFPDGSFCTLLVLKEETSLHYEYTASDRRLLG
jgi:hypothetical protein